MTLQSFSQELAQAVAHAGSSVVRVDDGSRLTATGVIWSEDGVIVTTSHGVERDEDLAVVLADGTRHEAALVGRDPDSDIAVLKVQATGLPAVAQGGEDDVLVGHIVLAIGRPGTAGLQATLGIVSARLDAQTNGEPEYIINTDAVIYPGFSGGPLVTVDGRMVGLSNRLFGRGMGVALGVPVVAQVVADLLAHGQVKRGYLGVRTQVVPLPEALRAALSLTQSYGLLTVQVEPGSPAEQAGLLLGDTLVGIGDKALHDVDDLRRHLKAGQTLALHFVRGGEHREATATLTAAE